MKLRDIVRKDPRELTLKLKTDKKKKRDIPDEWSRIRSGGEEPEQTVSPDDNIR